MIRIIQRRLIIPRGDTGSFSIPVLKQPNAGDIAVFTIFDCSTRTRMFQKQVAVEGDTISIAFTHTDTVNLKPGKYFWDIKFYANPVFVEDELVDGVEVDSYYAAYSLPDCEIRETADNYLVAPDGPDSYLTPEQLDIVTEAIAALQDAITKTETNVTHYPQIRDGVWYVWDAEVGDFVSTDSHTPTKVSELENDAGYLTEHQDLSNYVQKTDYATNSNAGIVKGGSRGVMISDSGILTIDAAISEIIKIGTNGKNPIVPGRQHESTFYGLAKAAGFDEKNSTLPVGQYTESAKSAISQMLNGFVLITGSTPTINALPGMRYMCGEVSTITITPPASGVVVVMFTSGSTVAALNVPSTVKWANGFDPSTLDANTVYEIKIRDGLYASALKWA